MKIKPIYGVDGLAFKHLIGNPASGLVLANWARGLRIHLAANDWLFQLCPSSSCDRFECDEMLSQQQ